MTKICLRTDQNFEGRGEQWTVWIAILQKYIIKRPWNFNNYSGGKNKSIQQADLLWKVCSHKTKYHSSLNLIASPTFKSPDLSEYL